MLVAGPHCRASWRAGTERGSWQHRVYDIEPVGAGRRPGASGLREGGEENVVKLEIETAAKNSRDNRNTHCRHLNVRAVVSRSSVSKHRRAALEVCPTQGRLD